MCKALDQKTRTAHEKLILVILEQEAKASNIGVFPADLKHIARTACCSVNTVRRGLKSLAGQHLITVTQRPDKAPFYAVNF